MSTQPGEQLATLLDKGINLLPLLPDDHVSGIEASCFGGSGMLGLEQSRYAQDAHKARLRIIGAVAGMGNYADENRFSFALSNNLTMSDGTHVQLKESERISSRGFHLTEDILEASFAVSSFVRIIRGNLQTAKLQFYAEDAMAGAVQAKVSGVFTSDAMKADYLESLESGVAVWKESKPTSAHSLAHMTHTVLAPSTGSIINFTVYDHRPEASEEKLRLMRGEA